MREIRRALVFFLFGGISLSVGCTQNPLSNTRCVLESGDLLAGPCFTQCESQCALEDRAGCGGGDDCVAHCEEAAAVETETCADTSYAHWRCLRLAGFPLVTCNGGKPSLTLPESECRTERERERAACVATDAGGQGEGAP